MSSAASQPKEDSKTEWGATCIIGKTFQFRNNLAINFKLCTSIGERLLTTRLKPLRQHIMTVTASNDSVISCSKTSSTVKKYAQ